MVQITAKNIALAALCTIGVGWTLFESTGFAQTRTTSTATSPSSAKPQSGPPALASTEVDFFHPDHQPGPDGKRPPLAKPAYGGRVIVRLDIMPASLNYAVENTASARRMLYELHETLAISNFETLELEPDLATSWDVEDTLFLREKDATGKPKFVFGKVTEPAPPKAEEPKPVDSYRVEPLSPHNPLAGAKSIAKSDVASLERGTVITFHLRSDVKWHDGEPFDARDVYFSWALYKNPLVHSRDKKYQFEKVRECEVIDAHTLRFFFDTSYFKALSNLADMCILPAHLYDLSHPDNARFDPEYRKPKLAADPKWKASDEEEAAYINDNPHNRAWVGLGPYQLVEWTKEYVEAKRFDGYFDPKRAGYLDTIRWRLIESDTTAMAALVNREIDFNDRLSADDYFGSVTEAMAFTDNFYKGFFYTSTYGYVCWNLARPMFSDVRVRTALAHCFDYAGIRDSFYHGQAIQVTGPQSIYSPGYDWSVEPITFDPKKADELFTAAGWYDRDGDGLRDKDGKPFEFEFAINAGSKPSMLFGTRFQEELAKLGVKVKIATYEAATFNDRCSKHDFDCAARGWALPSEVDPEQVWHSSLAKTEGSNYCGFADPKVDALITAGQREVDDAKRYAIWRELHRYLYEQQGYMYLFNPARKFALSKAIHGFQATRFDPNYVLRRWYYAEGTPGTRATAKK